MSDAGRQPATVAAIFGGAQHLQLIGAAAIGAVTCLVVVKGHGPVVRSIRSAIAYWRNPLRHQRVQICNSLEECEAAVRALKIYCAEYRVIGFDCEWVTVNASRRPVALLQLAAHNGYCALIRLNRLQRVGDGSSGGVPAELRDLLANGSIVKVGVGPMDDARNLARDYGLRVTSTLDLRHMARARGLPALGLAKMSLAHLGVTMDKDWRVSCSNWEAPELSARQIDYAAKDALVAVELFRSFAGHRDGWTPASWWLRRGSDLRETLDDCEQWLDVGFSAGAGGVMRKNQQLANGSTPKLTKRSMSTRATPLYENCYLQAPDGQQLCTCDRKKAEWYVQKGIGVVVAEAPLTVRLQFEPAGRAVGEVGQFYLQEKENRCVVCGCAESYQRKNIVPREYRKCFPPIMKDHTSHDVLLLCPVCHQRSNVADLALRHRLATLADAPFTGNEGAVAPTVENRDLKKLKSAAKALRFNGGKIPEDRVQQLQLEVLSHYPAGTELSADLLYKASELCTHEPNEDYCAHGEKVVVHFQQHPETGGLIELERMWRMHFLEVMRPRHMPDMWSVEHSVQKLGIRVAENRITDAELMLSGLNLTDELTEAIL